MRHFFWLIHYLRIFLIDAVCSLVSNMVLRMNGALIGKNFRVNGSLQLIIHPKGEIVVGNNVKINSSPIRNVVGGYQRTAIHVGKDGILDIGDNVGISNSTIVCMNKVIIEDNVLIGGGCNIYDTDFHPLSIEHRILNPDTTKTKTGIVNLKKGCFIGAHSIILKGVTIGENSIVGAGSIVSSDVPSNEVWAGNPLRKIRHIAN